LAQKLKASLALKSRKAPGFVAASPLGQHERSFARVRTTRKGSVASICHFPPIN
jgi:hypothetical protein